MGNLAKNLASSNLAKNLATNLTGSVEGILGSDLMFDLDSRYGITLATGVSQWSDQAPDPFDQTVTEATALQQPAYNLVGPGGLPEVVFDGVNDVMNSPGEVGPTLSEVFLCLVGNFASIPADARILIHAYGGAGAGLITLGSQTGGKWLATIKTTAGTYYANTSASKLLAQTQKVYVRWNSGTGEFGVEVDDVVYSTSSIAGTVVLNSDGRIDLAGLNNLDPPTGVAEVTISRLFMSTANPSASQIAQLDTLLASLYGV